MESPPKKLLDRVRDAVRVRHYSRRTEEAYVLWIRRFILFHGKRHPSSMGAEEVNAFLTHLAVDGSICASTQGQALSALLFLYRQVLEEPLPWMEDLVRAKRPSRLPVELAGPAVAGVESLVCPGHSKNWPQRLWSSASNPERRLRRRYWRAWMSSRPTSMKLSGSARRQSDTRL